MNTDKSYKNELIIKKLLEKTARCNNCRIKYELHYLSVDVYL